MGLSINSILSLAPEVLSKMTKDELHSILQVASKAANQRIRRLEGAAEKGVFSRAYSGLQYRRGDKPRFSSSKKQSRNKMISELFDIKNFYTAKTSTVKGAREVQKELERRLGGDTPSEIIKKIFSTFNKVQEVEPYFSAVYGSDKLIKEIRNEILSGVPDDEALQNSLDRIEAEYLAREKSF